MRNLTFLSESEKETILSLKCLRSDIHQRILTSDICALAKDANTPDAIKIYLNIKMIKLNLKKPFCLRGNSHPLLYTGFNFLSEIV